MTTFLKKGNNIMGIGGKLVKKVAAGTGYYKETLLTSTGKPLRDENSHILEKHYPTIVYRDVTEPTTVISVDSVNGRDGELELIKDKFEAAVINDTTGAIEYYLDRTDCTKKADGTPSNLTGADGSVFIIKPGFYIKSWMVGNVQYYSFSLKGGVGYRYSPRYAFAKYKGHRPSSGPHAGKLVSWSGVDITTAHDNRGRLYDFRTDARLGRNTNWNITPYVMYRDMMLLYKADIRNLNAQTELGYVSRASSADWSNYNGYNPIWQTGHMDDMPTFYSGNKAISVAIFVGGTDPLNTEVVSYMGIEDFFGHIWEWLDGLKINYSGDPLIGIAYICDNPAHFNDASNADNYTEVGIVPNAHAYLRETHPGEIIPLVGGGAQSGSSTFYCDFHYVFTSAGWRAALVGGLLADSAFSGPFFLRFLNSANNRHAVLGARLGLYLENTL